MRRRCDPRRDRVGDVAHRDGGGAPIAPDAAPVAKVVGVAGRLHRFFGPGVAAPSRISAQSEQRPW